MMSVDRRSNPEPLRIGMLAPPWLAVPPTGYGGSELIIDVLSRGLQDLGHEVLLFTVGESTCAVPKRFLFKAGDPDRMGASVLELRHVAAAYDAFQECDIVHDHTLVGMFLSQLQSSCPVVTTNHGPFNEDLIDLYRRTGNIPIIAISHDQAGRAPCDIPVAAIIHHGLDTARYAFNPQGGNYLVALGRMNPAKGVDIAIEIARRSGRDLFIGAKMREPNEKTYFEEVIRPLLGNGIEYLGEVNHAEKVELLGRARALVNPLQWPEPFGMVMIESLACGTPVLGTPRGAAPEIVVTGQTGYLANTVDELVARVDDVGRLDRFACRKLVEDSFSMEQMARAHANLYRSVLRDGATDQGSGASRTPSMASVA
jgi:glycosyltransferase involved in cell wall biosynthesis